MNEPILVIDDLSKSYKKGKPVLEHFNFSVEPGKITGLVGQNGCGKSTLLKLISGILIPNSGTITVCGQSVSEKTNAAISEAMAAWKADASIVYHQENIDAVLGAASSPEAETAE